jgi:hypothetical protein
MKPRAEGAVLNAELNSGFPLYRDQLFPSGTRWELARRFEDRRKEYARARARAYTMLEKEATVASGKRLSAKRLPASAISKRRPRLILARHARIIILNNASVSFGRRR